MCVPVSLVSPILSPLGSETELGILGISVLAEWMILSTAAVSKKSLRRTHTHTHQTCVYMSYTDVNRKYHIQAQACMLPSHMHSYTYSNTL